MAYNITGYSLLKEEKLSDVQGTGLYFKHIKSGARVCVIKNNDENKVFYIAFRTPPTDSTGVAHIIEHTVLCGSDKFPVKDPFMELAKGSLNTFLNAFTYPDKTCYPVASCNDKDFANLMDVYLNAVFHPNIYKKQEIFKQEGWHYELENEEDEIKYNGIVYSEMKGAYSSPDDRFDRLSIRSIFPDNEYGVDSGGDPEVIPTLTYENYLDFHRRYYHPVNSYIYIYGDVDVEERLKWLDENYLSEYDRIEIDSSVKIQKEFGEIKECSEFYSVDEPDDKGVFYSLNVFAGDTEDLVEGISFEVLDYVLCSAPGAPVKQALLDAGIGDDVIAYYNGDTYQPSFTIGVRNAKPGQEKLFKKTVMDALRKCAKDGLKEESLRAAVNTQEFRYREADFGRLPKGLMYGMTCLSTWLYNDDMPFNMLHMNEAYSEIKSKIGTRWFEELIEKYLINSKHGSLLTLSPKVGMNNEVEKKTAKKLADLKASMTKDEIKKLIEDTKALKKYQGEESTQEELETIPLLSLSDISKESRDYRFEEVFKDAGTVVFEDYDTNGVCYVNALFETSGIKREDVGYVGLLSDCISLVDTKSHTYQTLNDEINIYTGGIGTGVDSYSRIGENELSLPCLSLDTKMFVPEAGRALGFLEEIVTESLFTDKKRIRELLFMIRANIEGYMQYSGTTVASGRTESYFSKAACYLEATDGVDFYDFICNLTDNYEKMSDEICRKLKETSDIIFKRGNCIINVTCNREGLNECEEPIRKFLQKLPEGKAQKILDFTPSRKNEGLKTSGQVLYNVAAGNIYSEGFEYTGALEVLKSMVSYGYLWNEIRVKGGAYGTSLGANLISGRLTLSSYRDPNLKKTFEVFENLVGYLETFDADEREMTKAKIGVFGNLDAPLTPRQLGKRSFNAYMLGMKKSIIQKIRDEVFTCSIEDIRNTAKIVRSVLNQNYHCTLGSATEIDKNKDFYMKTRTLV